MTSRSVTFTVASALQTGPHRRLSLHPGLSLEEVGMEGGGDGVWWRTTCASWAALTRSTEWDCKMLTAGDRLARSSP